MQDDIIEEDFSAQRHVVFGAGQVGRLLADELLSLGHLVTLIRRGPAGLQKPGLTWMRGDATDPEFCDRACHGASVIYNCTNPSNYYDWAEILPPLFLGIQAAATRAGARLVVLDNLYMYGSADQGRMHEGIAMLPVSHKGELRKRLAESLFEAHARGELRATSGRASDYFGPGGVNTLVSNPRALSRMSRAKPVEIIGDPSARHSFNYIPDVARGLATLGANPQADGRAWHLPASWHGTTEGLVHQLAAQWGQPGSVRRLPSWVLRAAGVFAPTVRALMEMRYQWSSDFVLDDTAFCRRFGAQATPIDEASRSTAEWFNAQQGGASTAAA